MRRVLLDENLPVQLRHWLVGVEAATVEYMGWKEMRNGELLRAATGRFDVFVTSDRLLVVERTEWRAFGVVLLSTNLKPVLRRAALVIAEACRTVQIGTVVQVDVLGAARAEGDVGAAFVAGR